MSKTTLKEQTATKLDEYIALSKAENALYEAEHALYVAAGATTNDEHILLGRLAGDIGGLACDAALDAFKLAARSRDVRTIRTVVRALHDYGNDWLLFDELGEELFEEEEAA